MKIYYYWKTLLIAALIFLASALSGKQLNVIPVFEIKYIDKIIHFLMYFFFVLSMVSSFLKTHNSISIANKIIIITLGSLYGITLEGYQYFVTYDRSAELADMIANFLGSVTGILTYPILFKYKIFRLL